MNETYQWRDAEVDKMSHEAVLVNTKIVFSAGYNKGIVDRRFKSGYKIIPHVVSGITIDFTVEKNDRFKVAQLWGMGKKGKYGTYYLSKINDETVELIPIKLCQVELKTIQFGKTIELLYYGVAYRGY